MAISDKLTYLNETKTLLKNKINLTGANITTDTFRQYPTKLQNALLNCWNNEGEPIFTNWGTKVNGEGTNVKLDNTLNARMKLTPKGNTTQNGTPTPSSPINVNVVSGDNEVEIVGKNLLPNNAPTQTINGITLTVNEDGSIKTQGTATGTVQVNLYGAYNPPGANILSNGNYILSGGINNNQKITLRITRPNGHTYIDVGNTPNTFTIDSDVTGLWCYINIANGQSVNGTFYPMIEQGSTATTYEPYTSQNYPLYLGVENLFDKNNSSQILTAFFSAESQIASTSNVKTLYIACKPNTTYTISKVASSRFRVMTTTTTPAVGVSGSGFQSNDGGLRITITTGANANYLCVFYYNGSSDTKTEEEIRNSIQIEVGSKANSYTPYGQTPIELNKIGTYQDYIYKTDKWYLHKEVGKYQFKASDNWYGPIYYNSNQNIRWNKNPQVLGIDIKYDEFIYCNLLTYATPSQATSTGNDNLIVSNSGWTVSITYGGTTDRATMNSTFENKGMYFYYVLNTPTNTEITNTTLINQLENLRGAMSYEGQTNISGGFMIIGASALGGNV